VARIYIRDRQYCDAGYVVTPLVGPSITAITPGLCFFSVGDDVQGRANYARFGCALDPWR
jgi:hypothetical protein